MREKKKAKRPSELVEALLKTQKSHTDPLGSWTGAPDEDWEEPVQDADDL